ncbi:MAG: protein kinase domain-containing protein [Planctomycetota bacterium]|jgi:serine/threonine-protein kinase
MSDREPSILARLEQAGWAAPRLRLRPVPDVSPAGPRTGDVAGHYEILGELGRGGIGVVFRGRDMDLGRDVALKVLHERYSRTPELLRRFVEEARISGQLQHPGVVPVYEMGLGPGRRPYFTMKLVRGETLGAMLAAREDLADDRRRFLAIFQQICETVAYAHHHGVVHRDLKPSNVMIGSFGEIHVVDWGFAKILPGPAGAADEGAVIEPVRTAGEGASSLAGAVLGTPAYMSPEQAMGRSEELGERSDVFALGAILCEILTGKPPYPKERGDPLKQARQADLADAEERLRSSRADEELVALCLACLSPRSHDRPAQAGPVAESVDRHLTSVDERVHRSRLAAVEEEAGAARARARAAQARAAAAKERTRRRQLLALAVAVLVALLAGGGGWLWFERTRAQQQERDTKAIYAAMQEAARLQGSGELHAATIAAELAFEIAASEEVADALQARTGAVLEQVRAAERRAGEVARRHAVEAALVARLQEIRLRAADGLGFQPTKTNAQYAKAFQEAGIDPSQLDPAGIRSKECRRALVGALDEWAALRLAHEPPRAGAWSLVATASEASGEAHPELQRALAACDLSQLQGFARRLDPAGLSARELDRLALLLGALGDTRAAADLLGKAHAQHPADFWICYHLARCLMGHDSPRSREAVHYYLAALALRRDHSCLWHQLGMAYQHRGEKDRAVVAFRRGTELPPRHAAHHVGLGVGLRNTGSLREAIREFGCAVKLDPKHATAHRLLGIARYRTGDLDKAVEALETAVSLQAGEDAHAWLFLAMAHARLGHEKEARNWHERAEVFFEENPPDAALARLRAEAAALFGRDSE